MGGFGAAQRKPLIFELFSTEPGGLPFDPSSPSGSSGLDATVILEAEGACPSSASGLEGPYLPRRSLRNCDVLREMCSMASCVPTLSAQNDTVRSWAMPMRWASP